MRTRARPPRDRRGDAPQPSAPTPRGRRPGGGNSVRIVGGAWRGRRLQFPDVPGLRPTPDRVRETLFNWLMPGIAGARCLDLYAGSGVLGLEALSRGAAAVVLVERDPRAARALRESAARLGAGLRARLCELTAECFLTSATERFDVVFLDPPFDAGALPAALAALAARDLLSPGARVYLECRADQPLPALPPGWRLHRSGRAGDVGYHLAICPDDGRGGQVASAPESH
jgi:16S rRNA (guanine966-N2)-methyltransferase